MPYVNNCIITKELVMIISLLVIFTSPTMAVPPVASAVSGDNKLETDIDRFKIEYDLYKRHSTGYSPIVFLRIDSGFYVLGDTTIVLDDFNWNIRSYNDFSLIKANNRISEKLLDSKMSLEDFIAKYLVVSESGDSCYTLNSSFNRSLFANDSKTMEKSEVLLAAQLNYNLLIINVDREIRLYQPGSYPKWVSQ